MPRAVSLWHKKEIAGLSNTFDLIAYLEWTRLLQGGPDVAPSGEEIFLPTDQAADTGALGALQDRLPALRLFYREISSSGECRRRGCDEKLPREILGDLRIS